MSQVVAGLALLRRLRRGGLPVSTGTFDILIRAAGERRDGRAAFAMLLELRRRRLEPTAFTRSALMHCAARVLAGEAAANRTLALLLASGRRWRGEPRPVKPAAVGA